MSPQMQSTSPPGRSFGRNPCKSLMAVIFMVVSVNQGLNCRQFFAKIWNSSEFQTVIVILADAVAAARNWFPRQAEESYADAVHMVICLFVFYQ